MQEEPLLTENRWQRLEAEGRGHLQTVEEADEDAYGEEDEGFDETLQEEEEYVENVISGGDLSIVTITPYLSRDTTYCYRHCKGISHFPLLSYHPSPRPMPDRITSTS